MSDLTDELVNITYSTSPSRTDTLAEHLDQHPHVGSTKMDNTRSPPRLVVTLTEPTITPGIRDLLDRFDASIADARVGQNSVLVLELYVSENLTETGEMKIRTQGTSIVTTLTPDTLERSGFRKEMQATQYSRPGIVVLDARAGDDSDL